MELDRYDHAILRLLQQDARITNTLLAEKVNLSESACLRRVRALEESGLIQGYTALIDQHQAGYPVSVFVSITLDRQSQSGLEAFENAVRKVPEVMECYLMTGEHDYLLRLVVACGAGAVVLLELQADDGTVLRGRELSDQPWTGKRWASEDRGHGEAIERALHGGVT